MAYILSKTLSSEQRAEVLKFMGKSLKRGHGSKEIIDGLKNQGITYRRANMLKDIRRKKSSYNVVITKDEIGDETTTYNSLSNKSRRKSQTWFDNVYEPMRKAKRYSSKQANDYWDRIRTQSYANLQEAEDGAELWEIYEALK